MDNNTKNHSHCVAVFERHEDAETAVRDLQSAGFEMNKLSILGRDYHTEEHAVGFYNAGDRVRYWGRHGAFWGMMFGILFAPAFFWIPGVGPILTGGLIGSLLMGTIEGGTVGAVVGGGAGTLGAVLVSMGIPKDSVILYESAVNGNHLLLIATGTPDEVKFACAILGKHAANAGVHGT